MQHTETLIIGAGPAGLTAAYTLAKGGRDTIVLEADPTYVGGISRTAQYKGFLFDIGGHRFFSKSKEIVDLWNEILPEDFLDRPRLSRIYYGKKFYNYPLRAFEALLNLGIGTSIECMASFAWARLRPIPEPRNFHQWVRNAFGERLFSIFFKTYTEKVWGMSCDDISADWAAQRIKGLDLWSAVKDGLRRSLGRNKSPAAEDGPKTLIESFRYPRRGPGMMWEACARKVEEHGGSVVMDRKVSALDWNEHSKLWTVQAVDGEGHIHQFTAEHVISSAPMRELLAAVTPTPLSLIHARELKYRDFVTVVLIARSPRRFPDNWIYVHDSSVKVGRVQNFGSWSPEMIPDRESICLGLEYFCFEGDGLWSSPDAKLIGLARREISQIGLLRHDDVYDACVVRQPKAYPVYDEHYAEHVNMVRLDLQSNYPTLHLVGRNGMHKYNNQDHAMMTGLLTALNIIAGETRHDVWQVNEDAEYGESGVAGAEEALKSERLTPRRAEAA